MTPAELEKVRAACQGLTSEVGLIVRPGLNAEQNRGAAAFAKALSDLSPRLRLQVAGGKDPEGASLGLSRDGRVPVSFRVVPEGLELEVFLSALSALGGEPPQAGLDLPEPVSAHVMTLPLCTHCAPVAEALCRLAIGCERLTTWVVDLQQAGHYIERYHLTHTPAVIVNQRVFARGRKEDELAAELSAIAAGEHERFVLAARLENGEAAQVTAACLKAGCLTPGLCSLVVAENFQTRLGAMVCLQELARTSPELAARAVPELAALARDPDPRNRGDVAYLLGELARPEALPILETLLNDPDPLVVEAATEAKAALT